ncbi:hypothetical protein Ddye_015898 [Dipteronia dyeriana]|uniref:PGG domain-containing protein n=1 Tax=Dipteronia dyeriana TaxID=168575 RepID=A0AAD9U6R9_9ROSI|nr:hypothetical protein Ddye_015898 [Dipteronia dyeriana]
MGGYVAVRVDPSAYKSRLEAFSIQVLDNPKDLAFQIIHHYEELVNSVNARGLSPLHFSAAKPFTFKSGSHLGHWNEFIYHWGAAMQMQWEIKWHQFIKHSVPLHFFIPYKNDNKSPSEVFTETHKALVKEGGERLNKTSESCSVVATLNATIAFAASTTLPGGVKGESGTPTLENQRERSRFPLGNKKKKERIERKQQSVREKNERETKTRGEKEIEDNK